MFVSNKEMSADDNDNSTRTDDDEAEEAAHGHVWDWRSKSAVLIANTSNNSHYDNERLRELIYSLIG